MPNDEKIKENADLALSNLKKVIASGKKRSGTFYLVKGKNPGESGVAIFLQSKDKKGAMVKGAGKKLRKVSTGNKFCKNSICKRFWWRIDE